MSDPNAQTSFALRWESRLQPVQAGKSLNATHQNGVWPAEAATPNNGGDKVSDKVGDKVEHAKVFPAPSSIIHHPSSSLR